MGIRWHDATIPLREGMTVWPGDPPFRMLPLERMAGGASCNTSRVDMPTHCGTHMDAPWHFEENGARLDDIDPALFFGEAQLVETDVRDEVRATDLGPGPLLPRVLIKTRNSAFPEGSPFRPDYIALSVDAARRLVDEGVRLVGVDYLSVAPYRQPGQATHHILLGHGVLVVEGLRLQGFASGRYLCTILPLALVGADGSPCRAFLGR
ncbi:MAG TPA: cyclase family protein, partial [Candidatus Hydrogenedentes bacterium]|nr:cyclase family protein [Candidatus Hydrogenedentota bacterium]